MGTVIITPTRYCDFISLLVSCFHIYKYHSHVCTKHTHTHAHTHTMVIHMSISCLYTKEREWDLGQHYVHAPKQCKRISFFLSLKMKVEIVKFDNHSNFYFYFYFLLGRLKTPHLHDWSEFFVTNVGPRLQWFMLGPSSDVIIIIYCSFYTNPLTHTCVCDPWIGGVCQCGCIIYKSKRKRV
mgnify:CR=1 FL=1